MKAPTEKSFLKTSIYLFRRMGRLRNTTGTLAWKMGDALPYASIGFSIWDDTMRLYWTTDGEDILQEIPLTSVRVGYGLKYFYLCPGCGRRVAVLYAGKKFYCRHCHGITYESCQKSHDSFPHKLGFTTDSQYRNFWKTIDYSRELQGRGKDKSKRVGKAMLRRLSRYVEKSTVNWRR